jgi:chromosome segregation ATPase
MRKAAKLLFGIPMEEDALHKTLKKCDELETARKLLTEQLNGALSASDLLSTAKLMSDSTVHDLRKDLAECETERYKLKVEVDALRVKYDELLEQEQEQHPLHLSQTGARAVPLIEPD